MSVTIQVHGTRKFEMNLANGNFRILWEALGLQPATMDGLIGSVDGRVLLEKILSVEPSSIVREDQDLSEGKGTFIVCGITEEQAIRYFQGLDCLAGLACRREDPVIWH